MYRFQCVFTEGFCVAARWIVLFIGWNTCCPGLFGLVSILPLDSWVTYHLVVIMIGTVVDSDRNS